MAFEDARRQVDWEMSRANRAWEDVPNRLSPSPMELAFTDPAKHGQHRKGAIVLAPAQPPLQPLQPPRAVSKRLASEPHYAARSSSGGGAGRTKGAKARGELEA